MMRFLLAVAALSVFTLPAFAIDLEKIATFDPSAFSQEVTQCDRMAAHPSDPNAISEGLGRGEMDLPAAIEACTIAVADDPDNPRLNYQLARAYGYSGMHEEGARYREKAVMAGYPQSLFVIGYIRVTGWDQAEPSPCLGGELIRRSAHAGRYAGLVGFPHYYLMGAYDGCSEYPAIDHDEMLEFLDRAESSDFYRSILVDQLRKSILARHGR